MVLTLVGARGLTRIGAIALSRVGTRFLTSTGALELWPAGLSRRSREAAKADALQSSANGRSSCTNDRITYCARNAVSGLTELARRAGSHTATSETIVSTTGITMNTAGSRACT